MSKKNTSKKARQWWQAPGVVLTVGVAGKPDAAHVMAVRITELGTDKKGNVAVDEKRIGTVAVVLPGPSRSVDAARELAIKIAMRPSVLDDLARIGEDVGILDRRELPADAPIPKLWPALIADELDVWPLVDHLQHLAKELNPHSSICRDLAAALAIAPGTEQPSPQALNAAVKMFTELPIAEQRHILRGWELPQLDTRERLTETMMVAAILPVVRLDSMDEKSAAGAGSVFVGRCCEFVHSTSDVSLMIQLAHHSLRRLRASKECWSWCGTGGKV